MLMEDLTPKNLENIVRQRRLLETLPLTQEMGITKLIYLMNLLYKCRFVIERTNAWLDAFKALLVRFETNKIHWKALNLLAFTVILLRQL